VQALESELNLETLFAKLLPKITAHSATIFEKNRTPEFTDGAITGWTTSTAAIAIRDHLATDLPVVLSRVVAITDTALTAKSQRFKKKKDTALATRVAAGDIDMADAPDPSSATLQATINKAVATALKQQKPGPTSSEKRKRGRKDQSPGNPSGAKRSKLMQDAKVGSSVWFETQTLRTHPLSDEVRQGNRRFAGQQTTVRSPSVSTSQISQLPRIRGQTYTRKAGPGQSHSQAAPPRPATHAGPRRVTRRQRERPRRIEEREGAPMSASGDTWRTVVTAPTTATGGPCTVQGSSHLVGQHVQNNVLVFPSSTEWKKSSGFSPSQDSSSNRCAPGAFISQGDLWVSNPSLMPDELLDLPLPERVQCIIERMSLSMIASLRYQQDVHTSPGVTLPKELAFQISVGAKYMFHEPSNTDLFESAWRDFNRRLRWKLKFLFENQEEKPYDPDYDVRAPSHKQAPALPLYIELGLIKGRGFVYETIRKVPDADILRHPHKTLQPDVAMIREFLCDNQYVITGTDKNLGIAVSKRDWLIEKSQDILNDVNNYRRLSHEEAVQYLNLKCRNMEFLAEEAAYCIDPQEGTVAEFMRSKITLRGKEHHIPSFYGIPKIHKQPIKMRPIIPCHSAIQNPAAKYVSKKLKPLVQAAPTIIHGTKDLATKLSKLSINTKRKWYIVTGDVVAYYPNIPIERCIDIIYEQYLEFYWNIRNHDDPFNRQQQDFFRHCLRVGNTKLITQFQNVVYEQLNGLAMGVASSPDLANLYGYYFERLRGVLNHNDVFYYGRYIDDCLAIVYAESEHHAINLLQGLVQLDNCVIT
jgi:hypothetical protein